MSARPYFNSSVDQLERIFGDSLNDRKILDELRDELKHRNTHRAREFAIEVDRALAVFESTTKANTGRRADERVARKTTQRANASESISSSQTKPSFIAPPPMAGPESILAAWLTLEVLTPQALPNTGDLEGGRVLIRLNDVPEPWNDRRNWKRGNEKAVYWFLYLGELDLAKATQSLLNLFPDENADERTEIRGATTMAVVVLDGYGRPVRDKSFLSSFGWGYGQVRAGSLLSLANFPEAERYYKTELEKMLIRQDEDGEILPISSQAIAHAAEWITGSLNLPPEEVSTEGLAVRVPVWGSFGDAPEPELLNSFYIEDLTRVRAAFRTGDVGPALKAYLSGAAQQPRCDVVEDRAVLEALLAPKQIPLARWPSPGGHPLVLMQQAAVNHASLELRNGGLIGVNGPPGTGKTTLLRDIVAKVVVDRAIAMAEFMNPLDAFTHVAQIKLGQAFTHLYKLHDSLLGHEIVVASSNNKAVENVSREIPAMDQLANDLDPPLRYFSAVADCVAANGKQEDLVEGAAWGLSAAVLGNAANKNAFAQSFWWHEDLSLRQYLRAIVDGWAINPVSGEKTPAVVLKEVPPHNEAEALERWILARKEFGGLLNRVKEVASRLEDGREALARRDGIAQQLKDLEEVARGTEQVLAKAVSSLQTAESRHQRFGLIVNAATQDRDVLVTMRPGFFARLFRTRLHREWSAKLDHAMLKLEQARADHAEASMDVTVKIASQKEIEEQLRQTQTKLQSIQNSLRETDAVIAEIKLMAGDRMADANFWSRDDKELQRSSPWLAEELQIARDALFAGAFRLHRAFIDATAKRLRHNLGAAMAVMKGRALSDKQEPARRSIWASLFLVVPVISTTFASTTRLFGRLGRDQLGWLLIDEAGQAVPQAAVGAIWRAQRVIGIGDPLQIEPVVTVPPRLIKAIFSEFKVPYEEWAAPLSSVQSLSDRASWFGTTIRQTDGDIWVGSPLRVHRRCQEPMFSVSNQIAYSGLMVQNTPPGLAEIGKLLGESCWIDIDDRGAIGKWAEQEARAAADLLTRLLDEGLTDPDIFFITPFRIVARNLRDRFLRDPEISQRLPGKPRNWVNDRVGTIHTFQGKQAEAVVLVLGAPLEQSAGARRWAATSPNLLNVAVSRAKHRLYVIGSHSAWANVGVFRTLSNALPRA